MEECAMKASDKVDTPTLSTSKNDSLDDFKSPKIEPVVPTISKVKILNERKPKKTASRGKTSSHSRKKDATSAGRQTSNGKIGAQPSIESSFFKAANSANRGGHTCPLCMKYFADVNVGIAHSKNCATKNNVSTTKLLAAVALQERQADERLAIGLPPGPFVQPREQAPKRSRDRGPKADPDLQLALALSKSLQENELEQEFEEAFLLAAEHGGDEPIIEMTDSQRRKTLKNFGFLTNKPATSGVPEGPTKSRRRKHLGPTILQTRTQEARDRLLTEKIAEILMGNEAITQVCPQSNFDESKIVDEPNKDKHKSILRSRVLNEIHQTTKRIWDSAQLSSAITNFYVEELGSVVLPNGDHQGEKSANYVEDPKDPKKIEQNEEKESDESNETPPETDERILAEISESSSNFIKKNEITENLIESKNIHITDRQYRNALPTDWSNTLNISSVSDVVVLVKNNHIWAHKLVFHVRCSNILLDCEPNDDTRFSHVREKICWLNVDFLTAMAFLEFVYSGLIVKNSHIFGDNRLVAGVRCLARKYRLKDLFDYLRKTKVEIDIQTEIETRREGLRSPIVIEVNRVQSEKENLNEKLIKEDATKENSTITADKGDDYSSRFSSCRQIAELSAKSVFPPKIVDDKPAIETIDVESTINNCRGSPMSPDLFEETIVESNTMEEDLKDTVESSQGMSQVQTQDNSNLKVLAQLIADDDSSFDESSQRSSIFNNDEIPDNFSPVKPIHNHTTLSEGLVETPRSRGVVNETPKKIKDLSRSQRLPEKQKSNLSLFIEKIQKINAKAALDSYSEEESLAEKVDRRRFRNPFYVNNASNLSILECEEKSGKRENGEELLIVNEGDSQSESDKENCDDSLSDEEVKVNETSRTRLKNLEESSFVDETKSTDDEDTSMYSKYKKTHEHENSISNYRNILKQLNQSTPELRKNHDDDTIESLLKDNAIDLTQESDTDAEMPESSSSSVHPPNVRKSVNCILDTDSNDSVATLINSEVKSAFVNGNNGSNASNDAKNRDIDIDTISSSSVNKITAGKTKTKSISNSVEDLDKDLEELTNNSGKSLEFPDLDIFEVDEEIFAEKHTSGISLEKRSSCLPISVKSGSSRCKGKPDERMKEKSSIDELKNNEDEKSSNESSQETENPRNHLKYPDSDVFEDNEEIFTQSLKNPDHSSRRTFTPSPNRDSPSKLKSSRRKLSSKTASLEDLTQNEGIGQKCTHKFSNGAKSPRNASECPQSDFIDPNEEILMPSLENSDQFRHRILTPSPYSPSKLKSSRRKRSSKLTSFEDLTQGEETVQKSSDKFSIRSKSLMNSPEYPSFDYLDPNVEIFTQSLKNSDQPSRRTLTPSPYRDSPSKLKSSRRKRSSKATSFEDLTQNEETSKKCTDKFSKSSKSPINSPEYPHYDYLNPNAEIFTQSLKNGSLRRTLTPSPCSDVELPRKSCSFRRKRKSNEGKTRDSNLIDTPTDESSRAAKGPRTSPAYPDLNFLERNDEIFTQSFNYSPRRSLTPVSSRKTLQLSSPIVISSSPELDSDFEKRLASIERNTNSENAFSSTLNVSPLNSRQSITKAFERLSPLNFEASPEPDSSNSVKKFLSRSYSMPASTSTSEINRKKSKTPKKSLRLAASQDLTPPTNYDAMDTPELKRELDKYGIKPQKRKRARQLLNHIYNELHPCIPVTSSKPNILDNVVETSDDEESPAKKIGKISDPASNDSESDRENSLSQESVESETSIIAEEMDFSDEDTAVNKIADSTTVKEAFNALVKADKTLHNKLLIYEPLALEPLHATLKSKGFKCKLNDLMDFLDEECITFQVLAQLNQKRTRKPTSKKTKQNEKSQSTGKSRST